MKKRMLQLLFSAVVLITGLSGCSSSMFSHPTENETYPTAHVSEEATQQPAIENTTDASVGKSGDVEKDTATEEQNKTTQPSTDTRVKTKEDMLSPLTESKSETDFQKPIGSKENSKADSTLLERKSSEAETEAPEEEESSAKDESKESKNTKENDSVDAEKENSSDEKNSDTSDSKKAKTSDKKNKDNSKTDAEEEPPAVAANQIGINGIYKSYTNYGYADTDTLQAGIDAGLIVGGLTHFDGTDGQTTYFAGHNPGIMKFMEDNISVGSVVTITDADGEEFKYKMIDKVDVDENGYGVLESIGMSAMDVYDYGSGEESIIIQFCNTTNYLMSFWYGLPVQ